MDRTSSQLPTQSGKVLLVVIHPLANVFLDRSMPSLTAQQPSHGQQAHNRVPLDDENTTRIHHMDTLTSFGLALASFGSLLPIVVLRRERNRCADGRPQEALRIAETTGKTELEVQLHESPDVASLQLILVLLIHVDDGLQLLIATHPFCKEGIVRLVQLLLHHMLHRRLPEQMSKRLLGWDFTLGKLGEMLRLLLDTRLRRIFGELHRPPQARFSGVQRIDLEEVPNVYQVIPRQDGSFRDHLRDLITIGKGSRWRTIVAMNGGTAHHLEETIALFLDSIEGLPQLCIGRSQLGLDLAGLCLEGVQLSLSVLELLLEVGHGVFRLRLNLGDWFPQCCVLFWCG